MVHIAYKNYYKKSLPDFSYRKKMSINGFGGRQHNILKIALKKIVHQNDRLNAGTYFLLLSHMPRNDRKR